MGTGIFLQSCPVCGRRLKIAHEHDGTRVTCYTCYAAFIARNVHTQKQRPHDASSIDRNSAARRIMVCPGVAG